MNEPLDALTPVNASVPFNWDDASKEPEDSHGHFIHERYNILFHHEIYAEECGPSVFFICGSLIVREFLDHLTIIDATVSVL